MINGLSRDIRRWIVAARGRITAQESTFMRMGRLTTAVVIAVMAAGFHAAPQAQGGGGQRGAGGGRGAGAPAGAQGPAAAPTPLMSDSLIDGGATPLQYTPAR